MDMKEKCKLTAKYIDDNWEYLVEQFNETFDLSEFLTKEIEYEDSVYKELNSRLSNVKEQDMLLGCCGANDTLGFKRGFLTAILLRDVIL